jgi:AcrR family transcriptional regulator
MRTATFGVDELADAGRHVVARLGWSALTMRSAAEALGVTPMSLYRVVDDADHLRAIVADAIARRTTPTPGPTLRESLAGWAGRAYRDLVRHPGSSTWVLGNWTEIDGWLAIVEELLALADDEGIRGEPAVDRVNAVFTYVLLRAQVADALRSQRARALRPVRAAPESYPHFHANLDQYDVARTSHHFDVGLRALLDGLVT